MSALGHQRFVVAGHDRGGRVGYRMALDYPERVRGYGAIDMIPTYEVWAGLDGQKARKSWHWLFLAQPAPFPERMIAAAPDVFFEQLFSTWGQRQALHPQAVAEYRRHYHDARVVTAMCEDYRAGATVDLADDLADKQAGRKLTCPTLVLWARRYLGGAPAEVWRAWAEDVRDVSLDCGHFLAEEEPEACAAALRDFMRSL